MMDSGAVSHSFSLAFNQPNCDVQGCIPSPKEEGISLATNTPNYCFDTLLAMSFPYS